MYFPFFRGKQFELLAIRELSTFVSSNHIFPIIEPVKRSTNALKVALDSLVQHDIKFLTIINPACGELVKTSQPIVDFLNTNYSEYKCCYRGIIISNNSSLADIKKLIADTMYQYFFVYTGVPVDIQAIIDELSNMPQVVGHIFDTDNFPNIYCKKIKRKHPEYCVCLKDCFNKCKNADYPNVELFSEQHLDYENETCCGFSDYLIAGKEYSETGGPAFAIALHLTFFDQSNEDIMYIYHFVSDSIETSKDPAGKFLESLDKMIKIIDNPRDGTVFDSLACEEFRRLHSEQHYPGLGYLKKLSMLHHVQIINDYLAEKNDE